MLRTGQPITADLEDWASWGEEPNRGRLLVELLMEPARISQYLQANCTTVKLGGEDLLGRREHIHYGFFNRTYPKHTQNRALIACIRRSFFMVDLLGSTRCMHAPENIEANKHSFRIWVRNSKQLLRFLIPVSVLSTKTSALHPGTDR